jgi:hypothetical protein
MLLLELPELVVIHTVPLSLRVGSPDVNSYHREAMNLDVAGSEPAETEPYRRFENRECER